MNNPPSPLRARLRHAAAFSLIEVTLAIGIVAFAFISLFGLLPTGLNVFRGAIDTSIGSQIVQQVTDAAQQTDFEQLIDSNNNNKKTYYDEQGNLIRNTDGSDLSKDQISKSIYTVQVEIVSSTNIPSGSGDNSGQSGSGQATSLTKDVATLHIMIAKNPGGHDSDPFNASRNLPVNRYVAYVARNLSTFGVNSPTT